MLKIIIQSIKIQNFKGISSFEANFNAKESFLIADNGIGKTTVADAISYILTGKDSKGDAEFSIKPLDKDNNEIHRLETIVELNILANDALRTLKKVFYEKWQKVAGAEQQTFTGNTTDYYIDGVKIKTKKAYDEAVIDIIGADAVRVAMLSNPLNFLFQKDWKERRKILCSMVEVKSYSDLMASADYVDLTGYDPNIIAPEAFKKHCSDQINEIEKQKEKIPVQLGVLDAQDAEIKAIDFEQINRAKWEHQEAIKEIKKSLSKIRTTDQKQVLIEKREALINPITKQMSEKSASHREVMQKIELIAADFMIQKSGRLSVVESELRTCETNLARYRKQKNETEIAISESSDKVDRLNKTITDLRQKFKDIQAETSAHMVECPTCRRAYDADHIDEMIANFEKDKINRITSINENGKKHKLELEQLNNTINVLNNQLTEINTVIKENTDKYVEIEAQHKAIIDETCDTQEYIDSLVAAESLQKEITALKERIKEIQAEYETLIANVKPDSEHERINADLKVIAEYEQKIKEFDMQLMRMGRLKENQKTREAYLAQESELNKQHQSWERKKYLITKLVREYMTQVEVSVNSKFSLVKFKLFEALQNGGEVECCTAIVDGVPQDDFNTAKNTNAGIDVINALSTHYGIRLPVIVDNRESITILHPTDSQVINMFKDEKIKTLTVK